MMYHLDVRKKKDIKREERAKFDRDKELSDLRAVLLTPEGRRVFWRILETSQWLNDPFVQGDDGYSTTRNTGKQAVGLWLFSEMLEAKPDSFVQMQREYKSELMRKIKQEEEYNKEE